MESWSWWNVLVLLLRRGNFSPQKQLNFDTCRSSFTSHRSGFVIKKKWWHFGATHASDWWLRMLFHLRQTGYAKLSALVCTYHCGILVLKAIWWSSLILHNIRHDWSEKNRTLHQEFDSYYDADRRKNRFSNWRHMVRLLRVYNLSEVCKFRAWNRKLFVRDFSLQFFEIAPSITY